MEGTWVSLLPFLIVIPLAIWLREILPGLVVGLLVGAFCLEGHWLRSIERAVDALLQTATEIEHMKVIAFLYLFGALIGMMQITGGMKGFVQWISRKIHSKRRMLLFIWFTIPFTFFTPMFRIMLIGPVMKSLIGKFHIDKRKMAYIIDVSTEPIIVLLPIATAFVGFMTSVVEGALRQNGIDISAYHLFVASLPYNFFAIIGLIVGIVTTFKNIRIGKEDGETVDVFEDNVLVREALETVPAGTVLVVDGKGSRNCALLGDRLAQIACERGLAGVIINGCIRDSAEIAAMPLGVMAIGTCPVKSKKEGKGSRDAVLEFGGVRWEPGTYVYADSDGIVVSQTKLSEK